jgi:hypothetical protein
VFEIMSDTTAIIKYCFTLDGTTPTAGTAGTCDVNSSIYSVANDNAFAAITASGTTLKVIGTKSAMTNSAVASATYTITAKPATNPVGYTTPVKITSAGANIVDEMPYLIKANNGDLFVFYSESTTGVSIDGGAPARVMFKKSTNSGASWTNPTTVSCLGGDPATGCFYNADATFSNIAVGGGVTYNGTLLIELAVWGVSDTVVEGVVIMRSTDNGATWTVPAFLTTPTYSANKFINPTVNLISIPPASSGVTGPCAAGCIMTLPLGENGGVTGPTFSYDDGVTWADPVNMYPPLSLPGEAEERAIIWAGGMKLMMFERGGIGSSINFGWPEGLLFIESTNLGTSWNTWTNAGATVKGGVSNLPLPACSVSPSANIWSDFLTRPSVSIDPQDPSLATLLYGNRMGCNSVNTFNWSVVTFNIATAFTNLGQDLPVPQTLSLYTGSLTAPHTTYSYSIPLGVNSLLMAYEQGNTSSTEDIYTTILIYQRQMQITGGMTLSGGVTLQ